MFPFSSIIYSIFIYGMTMVCMFLVSLPLLSVNNKYSFFHNENRNIVLLTLCTIFGIIFGMRWDVGEDNLEYLDLYVQNHTEGREFLFKFLNDSLYTTGCHFSIYFGVYAFIQIFLLLYALRKQDYIWPFLVLSLFGGNFFWDWMNGMRQEMASCIMVFGMNFIINRKPLNYLICVILAVGFHISALIFLPLYPLLTKCNDLVPRTIYQYGIYLLTVGVALSKVDILSKIFPAIELLNQYDQLSNYGRYDENVLQTFAEITKIGYLFYILAAINCIIIAYSPSLRKFYNSKSFTVYYNLYFWGIVFETFVASNMVLARPFRYFRIYKLIIIAYLLYYLYRNKSHINTISFILVTALLIAGILLISITSPFNFYFDV